MKNREQIIEAAIRVISRYGVKRTTMNDVAEEANIVRQTLYNAYASKEDLLRATIRYGGEQSLAAIKSECAEATSLSEKLDIVFEHSVVKPFEWIHASPEAADIIDGFNDAARDELATSYEHKRAELQTILEPYGKQIEAAGLNVRDLSDYIQSAAKGAKGNAKDKDHLLKLLKSLKLTVLALVEDGKSG
ncbi:TetR/AcrR family transcriptional regulator [Hoeflea sp. TYP-13]|uniref:TetR/AcrR family transcriptional regulator n=1 Tax=Hoeflea sp. TYP-13 TaxID=3230023 RepID=UPI0034C5C5BC